MSAVIGMCADLSLIDVMIGMSACPSPSGEGIFLWRFTPSAYGTSPKYDKFKFG